MANNLDFIDLHNKHAREGQGFKLPLILYSTPNWREERELRENTGIGRPFTKNISPKLITNYITK